MRLFKCKFFSTIKSTLHFFHWHKCRVWLIVCVDRLLVVIVIMLTIRLHINDDFQHTPVLLPALFCAPLLYHILISCLSKSRLFIYSKSLQSVATPRSLFRYQKINLFIIVSFCFAFVYAFGEQHSWRSTTVFQHKQFNFIYFIIHLIAQVLPRYTPR